jgi:CBS domain containing-hemolysin-like protein
MTDLIALLAAVALVVGNGFFVAAEFALISARRDRLEPVAVGPGPAARAARTVLRATRQLPRMLAASQLAITVFSLLLGRLGEPTVTHLLEQPLRAVGLPAAAAAPIGFVGALLVVVVAHMVLGETVPRNIALAGPERAALVLVPPLFLFSTAVRPVTALFTLVARGVLWLLRVRPRDELEAGFTSDELADLIAESQREGLLDAAESSRLTRTLAAIDATVADVLVPRDELVSLPSRPRVGDVTAAVATTGFSRFPVRSPDDGSWAGYLHVKDILDLLDRAGDGTTNTDTDGAPVPPNRIRGLPAVRADARLDTAVATLRASRAHLARAVDPAGTTVGLVALEDLVEAFVGTVRDATHRGV